MIIVNRTGAIYTKPADESEKKNLRKMHAGTPSASTKKLEGTVFWKYDVKLVRRFVLCWCLGENWPLWELLDCYSRWILSPLSRKSEGLTWQGKKKSRRSQNISAFKTGVSGRSTGIKPILEIWNFLSKIKVMRKTKISLIFRRISETQVSF